MSYLSDTSACFQIRIIRLFHADYPSKKDLQNLCEIFEREVLFHVHVLSRLVS